MILLRSLFAFSIFLTAVSAFVVKPHHKPTFTILPMSTASIHQVMHDILKKSSKTLAVGLEYVPEADVSSPSQLETLSMQLRQCKVSVVVTSHVDAAIEFVKEQESARGNFPGPCPVIYTGDDINAAIDGGIQSIIVKAGMDVVANNVFVIRRVDSVDDVAKIGSGAFFVDADQPNINAILDAIPDGSIIMAAMDAMQAENAELERAKQLKVVGVSAILLRNACVGDGEDIEYTRFAVDGLTKKKSSTFNMTGLTGSTNGHFGGVASSQAKTWLRKKRS